MAQYFQLVDFRTWITTQGNTGILISNSTKYYDVLVDAFPEYRFGPRWPDQRNRYEWGAHINGIDEEARLKVVGLLELFQRSVCIDDSLHQTFALDLHSNPSSEGGGRTSVGTLVYNAKPYKGTPTASHKTNAIQLANHLETFIACHPSYFRSDFLLPVPFYESKTFDLPHLMVDHLCKRLKIQNGIQYVKKIKSTKSMKDASEEEKFNIMRGAFEVLKDAPFRGKRITIVDDIYQSGNTLHELASVLRERGAIVQGLVATKTLRTFNQDLR